jgi:uncharacterized protein DUF2630
MEQDERILARISEMVEDERRLRTSLASGEIDGETEQQRLGRLERELDQCWDLLRQRRARREYGQDPDEAAPRDPSVVERYLQ